METVHILILGYVQGVGFRQAIKRLARKLGVTGWVRNLPEGSVEVYCTGNSAQLTKIVQFCKKGPLLAEVRDVQIIRVENPVVYKTFETRYE